MLTSGGGKSRCASHGADRGEIGGPPALVASYLGPLHAGNVLYRLDEYGVWRQHLAVGLACGASELDLSLVVRCGVGSAQRQVTGACAPKFIDACFTIGRGLI